jgi:hypothetical protein
MNHAEISLPSSEWKVFIPGSGFFLPVGLEPVQSERTTIFGRGIGSMNKDLLPASFSYHNVLMKNQQKKGRE